MPRGNRLARTRRLIVVLGISVIGGAFAAAQATAAPFYASPGGSGGPCTQMSHCSLTDALIAATSGDTVFLAGGTYPFAANLDINESIAAEDPNSRPVLTSTAGNVLRVFDPGSVVSDISLIVSNMPPTSYALNFQAAGARAERVDVLASGTSTPVAAAMNTGVVISDSLLRATGPGAFAVAGGNFGGTLRNVTAIASGSSSRGFVANDGYMLADGTMTTTVENSIVRGDNTGFSIQGTAARQVVVNTDHSNYSATNSVTGPYATLNGTPQTALPLFVGSGDFHQLATSPTVNAGAPVAGLSATDLDRQARNQGGAPDIGADELDVPVPAAPKQQKPKCKKKKKKKRAEAAKKKKKKCKRKRK